MIFKADEEEFNKIVGEIHELNLNKDLTYSGYFQMMATWESQEDNKQVIEMLTKGMKPEDQVAYGVHLCNNLMNDWVKVVAEDTAIENTRNYLEQSFNEESLIDVGVKSEEGKWIDEAVKYEALSMNGMAHNHINLGNGRYVAWGEIDLTYEAKNCAYDTLRLQQPFLLDDPKFVLDLMAKDKGAYNHASPEIQDACMGKDPKLALQGMILKKNIDSLLIKPENKLQKEVKSLKI